jgi:membrane-bound metal-dependent hydrolase YbcI (DUF457 family)
MLSLRNGGLLSVRGMFICIYLHMCVRMCIYMYVWETYVIVKKWRVILCQRYVYRYLYLYVYIYVCIYTCMYVCMEDLRYRQEMEGDYLSEVRISMNMKIIKYVYMNMFIINPIVKK